MSHSSIPPPPAKSAQQRPSASLSLPLWQPSTERIKQSRLLAFMHRAQQVYERPLTDYQALWQASVDDAATFWSLVWDECGVIGTKQGPVLVEAEHIKNTRFFPEARLNFAENLLTRRDESVALVFWGEDRVKRQLSTADLYALVSRLQQALRAAGVQSSDRVAGWLPNGPEAIAAMLATASLGAIWTSCSPDFGVDGVYERFSQTTPEILFCCDGYAYNGKWFAVQEKVDDLVSRLPTIKHVICVSYDGSPIPTTCPKRACTLTQFLAKFTACDLDFPRFSFNHPLFILYSSGTTGPPKCIVHGAGGTLLQHLKEHQLHADICPKDRVFFFTTCGWMMWNWLASALASRATLLLYDGSPFVAEGQILWEYAAAWQATHLGVSAKYIDELKKRDIVPSQHFDLSALRALFSTGSPLTAAGFEWVYRAVKTDLNLASISGGTDIISCFALGCPILPVYAGELQCRGLGMAVEVFDEAGHSIERQKGELVCVRPFPSMPLEFWHDPDGQLLHQAYFSRFENVWCHGDWAEITAHQGLSIYGRSDTVLNPGGVRIGTAEIYSQVEPFADIQEALAVGQRWQGDERIILFVILKPGLTLSDDLIAQIKKRIRTQLSPRHTPAHIIQVPDFPRTRNGKIVELAVKKALHGEPINNLNALANPESLALFQQITEDRRQKTEDRRQKTEDRS